MFKMKNTYKILLLIFASVAGTAAIAAGYYFTINYLDELNAISLATVPNLGHQRIKAPRQTVKGLYLTAYSASRPEKVNEIISLIKQTELNAVIIDVKDYSGKVLFDSKIDLVNELKTDENRIGSVPRLIRKLHKNGIYVIARQTVFQDPILAKLKPEWAIKAKSGGLWRDNKGLSWVDPTKKEVWEYNLAIAKEAAGLGFDEINFDYMRFPSDGNMSNVSYSQNGKKLYQSMSDFYKFLGDGMAVEPVWISIDMFGFAMEKSGEDDMSIGQRLADAVDNFDYICPMMYPSHYPPGHLGFDNPAEHPGAVIDNGMKKGLPQFAGKRAQVRPWLQAFNIGASYGANNIRAEIDTVENYSDAGWMLWNASNRYTSAGLK